MGLRNCEPVAEMGRAGLSATTYLVTKVSGLDVAREEVFEACSWWSSSDIYSCVTLSGASPPNSKDFLMKRGSRLRLWLLKSFLARPCHLLAQNASQIAPLFGVVTMADDGRHAVIQHLHDRTVAVVKAPTETAKPEVEPRAAAGLAESIRAEHQLNFPDVLRLYPKAIAWSAFFSVGVISTAFDQQLVGSLFSVPQFRRDFGYRYRDEVKQPACLPLLSCSITHSLPAKAAADRRKSPS